MASVAIATQAVPSPTAIEPALLHEYFEAQVAQRPGECAVEALGERLTYAELDQLANQIAHWLRGRGVGPGCLVGLYLTKSCRLFASLLAILKAGAGYVPVDPRFPKNRVQDIFVDADVRAVICESQLAANLSPDSRASVLLVDRDAGEIARQPCAPPHNAASADSLCYVIYTSGSTGRPKGVMIAHRNAVTFVKTLPTVYGLVPEDRVYQGFSVAFDASVEEIWAAFSIGGTLAVPPDLVSRSPLDVADFITANRITYFSTVPTFLALINKDLPTVRLLVLGGEACMPELVTRWARPERRLLNTYGPTETTVVATWAECVPNAPVTIGQALPGYRAFVLDESLRPVGPGEKGELFIGGAAVALGYLNHPELTTERFLDNPFGTMPGEKLYRTHDLVRLGRDGALQFLGRIDGQVKIRGFRVELSEIEAVLMEYPGIKAAAVRMVSEGDLPELAAYVVIDESDEQLNRPGVAELLRSRLPDYMTPKYLDVVSCLPLLTSGKVDRNQLAQPGNLLKSVGRCTVPPATEMECAVAEAWEKCLQASPISVEDDFFLDLGAHSLLAARVVTELRTKLATPRISVRDLYKFRTVRTLSARLQELGIGSRAIAATDRGSQVTPSQRAFATVPAWERWICVALQAVAVMVYYGSLAAPLAYAVVMTMNVMADRVELGTALWLTTGLAFAYWPTLLGLSIALKWLVIGRYRPGQYPVWGLYYFRWWLVSRFQALSWSHMFVGTPLMSLYYRAMGAKVGSGVTICTPFCSAFDLVTISDGASIGVETHMLGYRVENGMLIIGRIDIAADCFVGMHSYLGLNTCMAKGSRLDDMSALVDGSHLARGEGRRGFPALPAEVSLPQAAAPSQRRRPFLYGLIHVGLIYAMGYFLILAGAPAVALVVLGLVVGGLLWAVAAAFAAVPISILWYVLLLLVLKRLFIGRIEPGTYALESRHYLRHWFLDYALNNTRSILLPVYATVYFPPLLRMLGAKIGPRSEISTVMHVTPDLVEIGGGSFLADACLVGGCRVHGGLIELKRNRIGEKAFIGNSAVLPGGTDVGDNALLGALSSPPIGSRVRDNDRCLGSPAFVLPHTQKELCFNKSQTYCPSRSAQRQRAISDAVRVLLPGLISAAGLVAFVSLLVMVASVWPWWIITLAVPALAVGLACASMVVVAGIKWLLIGSFEPTVRPLWCRYVWNNEIVNGTYESVAEQVMPSLLGTPFVSFFLRLMGCKIGKWTFLETTYFSEFDLVEVGDHAALNLGATIQTHLFEDRVMKADYLRIGKGASVGNMAVVLYDTDIKPGACLGPLSLLMKGETLPAGSRWFGIPSEPLDTSLSLGRRLGAATQLRCQISAGCMAVIRRVNGNTDHLTPVPLVIEVSR